MGQSAHRVHASCHHPVCPSRSRAQYANGLRHTRCHVTVEELQGIDPPSFHHETTDRLPDMGYPGDNNQPSWHGSNASDNGGSSAPASSDPAAPVQNSPWPQEQPSSWDVEPSWMQQPAQGGPWPAAEQQPAQGGTWPPADQQPAQNGWPEQQQPVQNGWPEQ